MNSKKFKEYGAAAEQMYVMEGKSAAEIAEALPIGDNTVRRWATKGDWDRRRRERVAGPKASLDMAERVLYNKLAELEDAGDKAVGLEEIKELTALVNAVNNLKKHYDPFEIAVLAGGEYVGYVKEAVDSPADRELLFEVWSEFVEEMRKR